MELYQYNEKKFQSFHFTNLDDLFTAIDVNQNNWVNFDRKISKELLEEFVKRVPLHPLVQEDLLSKNELPKMEFYEDHLFALVKMMDLRKDNFLVTEDVCFILTNHTLFTFQDEVKGDVFHDIRNRLTYNIGKVRKSPMDYLFWRLLDVITKQYHYILEHYRTKIEQIEEGLMNNDSAIKINEIVKIKRELNQIRKFVLPLKDEISLIRQESNDLIHKSTLHYFRDIQDHLINLESTFMHCRELVRDVIELQNSNQAQHMNQIIKILTIISSIFIPLTFLVGVYGMNFKYFPELEFKYAYPLLWLVMVMIGGGMWAYFKRKNWI
jgi:magnesium transporter